MNNETISLARSLIALDEPVNQAVGDADDELMRRLSGGDDRAMCLLIERHGPMLHRLVGRLTAWSSDQDDLFQEVLVTAWERSGDYDSRGSLAGWLKTIAVNKCKNHFRARDAMRRVLDMFAIQSRPSESETNIDLERIENSELTKTALTKLNALDRSVLVLFYLEELTGEQIAEITNAKVETVHVQLHRARKRLKNLLAED
ncbi:MAG: sigma-70 family RNA polymerase sigma factor [Planctomycetales bacterium]|nr:sigma-70 family RNA polymerase sigma factor [Planctomycetales bacterium]